MLKHKYTVFVHADYTSGLFGESFHNLLPDVKATSQEVEASSIKSIKELSKEEQEHILDVYREGLEKINLPLKGKLVPTIKYMGTFEEVQEEPNEINLFENF